MWRGYVATGALFGRSTYDVTENTHLNAFTTNKAVLMGFGFAYSGSTRFIMHVLVYFCNLREREN